MKLRVLMTFATLATVIVVSFLAYNILSRSPCDTVFEQTSAQLDTKLKLIAAEGEISIGKEKIQDLTEAAQLTALNLKTCCIVLNAGQLDAGQFLSCKKSAREYDRRIDTVVSRVQAVNEARAAGDADLLEKQVQQFDQAVEEAQTVANAIEREAQSLETRVPPAKRVSDEENISMEQEPNNDLFSPNHISMNTWIKASISDESDSDHYLITTPSQYRDIIQIELKNGSTSAKPRIGVYQENKKWLGGTSQHPSDITPGQDQLYKFSSGPDTSLYIYITEISNKAGDYQFIVKSLQAYDNFEPNDDILNATAMAAGQPIAANFMDAADQDYYLLEKASNNGTMKISFDNLSTRVKPRLGVFDQNKKWVGGTSQHPSDITAGQNLSYSFSTEVGSTYYLWISNLSGVAGSYRLSLEQE